MNKKNLSIQARIWLMERRIEEAIEYLDGTEIKRMQLAGLRKELARLLAKKERKGL